MIKSVRRERLNKFQKLSADANIQQWLTSLNVDVTGNFDYRSLRKKAVSLMKRKVRNTLITPDLLKAASFSNMKISIVDQEIHPDIPILFKLFLKQEINDIVSVELMNFNGEKFLGFASLGEKLPDKYHKGSYRLRSSVKSFRFFDLSTLIAESIILNALYEFVKDNMELVRYEILNLIGSQYLEMANKGYGYSYLMAYSDEDKELLSDLKRIFSFINDVNRDNENETQISRFGLSTLYCTLKQGDFNKLNDDKLLLGYATQFAIFPLLSTATNIQEEEKQKREQLKHAKAWQLKKNIPQKVLDSMATSKFLEKYSFVEYDADVDLNKVKIIENEFIELTKIINIPKSEGSFRIKKLGNYKAGGLYFSYQKATCVDLDSPASFVHELMHQIDHTSAEDVLSDLPEFFLLHAQYKACVEERIRQLPSDSSFRTMWESKNKYNKNYYLKATEAFARCGEMYVKYILGFNSPLQHSEEEMNLPVYPYDVNLLESIKTYFGKLLH